MKIAYLPLPHIRIDEIARGDENAIAFLKETYNLDIKDYDYIVVYKEKDGSFEYQQGFKVEKSRGTFLLVPRKKIKRPIDSIHKFWARKPWWAVAQYIMTYSKEGDTIYDPMCGSAIAGYEALRLRRRAIMQDLNPFAIFLARNTIRPLKTKMIISSFNEVLDRQLDREMHPFPKGTSIRDVLSSLYQTPCRKCNGKADVRAFIWDTIYEFTGLTITKPKNLALLEAIKRELNGGGFPPSKVSQHWLNMNWERVLKTCRELCETKFPQAKESFKGPQRPRLITKVFGRLVQTGVYKRKERRLILAYYFCRNRKCKNYKGVIEELVEADWSLIREITHTKSSYSYPSTRFIYPNGKTFDTARPDSLFVPNEILATWNDSEFKDQSEKVHHLFTKRNLLALSILFWSIEQVENIELKESLLLAFTETLYRVSKLNSYEIRSAGKGFKIRRATMWRENRFSIPPDFSEENVYYRFDRSVAKICDAKDECNLEIGEYYREAKSADEFVTNSSNTVLFVRRDAKEIQDIFPKYKDLVNMVFTDPPYGDAIQYFELCTFWTSWLLLDEDWKKTYGNNNWWKNEIIKNDVQEKTLNNFASDLTNAFRSLASIVIPDASWVITYHKREPKYWSALSDALLLCGLGFYHEDKHELLGRSFNPSSDFRFLETDAYTVWKRLVAEKIKSMVKAAEEFFAIVEPYIQRYYGVLPRTIVEKAYVEMSWSTEKDIYEKFFDEKFDIFLQRHTIQIPTKNGVLSILRRDVPPTGISPTTWKELWDKSYGKLASNRLLEEVLRLYIKGKLEKSETISLDDIYTDIIRRIDGRITKEVVLSVMEEIAQYDWLKGTYRPREKARETEGLLMKWIEPRRKEIKLPRPPEFLISDIALKLIEKDYSVYVGKEYEVPRLSSVYSRKIIKRVEADFRVFPLVLEKQGTTICVDVNTFTRASQVLLKRDVKVVILYGRPEIKERSHYFKNYMEKDRLVLVDVRDCTTDEVINKTISLIEGNK